MKIIKWIVLQLKKCKPYSYAVVFGIGLPVIAGIDLTSWRWWVLVAVLILTVEFTHQRIPKGFHIHRDPVKKVSKAELADMIVGKSHTENMAGGENG
ncbi:MAG: hypothetical protein WC455_26390 [Dehalococcoidia bacterium]|jgi:hypothetical protein